MKDKITDILIEGNSLYQWKLLEGKERHISEEMYPKLSTLILTCMDPRIDVYRIFQLKPGDVFVLRNAGNVLTDDVLRGILLAVFKYSVRNIIVLGHTDCGMKKVETSFLRDHLSPGSLSYICGKGYDVGLQLIKFFKIFGDEIFNIKNQMGSISAFRGLPVDVRVIGMLYDVETGWVYEYEHIKDLESFKDFQFNKSKLTNKKRQQFLNFLDGFQEDIKQKPEKKERNSESSKKEEPAVYKAIYEIGHKNADSYLDANEILIENAHTLMHQIKMNPNQLKLNNNFPEIKIPKISIPKIKIYLPKVYLKGKNEENGG